jgi:transposase-like protein
MESNKDSRSAGSAKLAPVIQIDEQQIRDHLGQVVRGTVEETLNAMLNAEADALCRAGRYERSADRASTRAGHYTRKLQTTAGTVELKIPKLRSLPFETAIIERYRRRESSVEEALMEMYLAGVSVRRVEDITEALWGERVSSGTVSRLNQQLYERIEAWRNQPIVGTFAYVYVDGISLKRAWAGEIKNVAVLRGVERQRRAGWRQADRAAVVVTQRRPPVTLRIRRECIVLSQVDRIITNLPPRSVAP